MSELRDVPLEAIDPPENNIRERVDEEQLEELVDSIRAVGLIEPMVVEPVGERYRIMAGYRRWLACKRAGLVDVPVVVRDDAGEALEAVQVQENIIRVDNSPAEEARLFKRLYELFDQDIEKVAARVRLSVGYVDRRMSLLVGDDLVLAALDAGQISLGVAEALNTITAQNFRRERLDAAVRGGATVNLARRWAAECNGLAMIQRPEGEQRPEAPSEAPYVPVASSLQCWFCEGNHELHTLQMVQMHAGCIMAANALLKKIGRDQ